MRVRICRIAWRLRMLAETFSSLVEELLSVHELYRAAAGHRWRCLGRRVFFSWRRWCVLFPDHCARALFWSRCSSASCIQTRSTHTYLEAGRRTPTDRTRQDSEVGTDSRLLLLLLLLLQAAA